jgi:hypothetical protein
MDLRKVWNPTPHTTRRHKPEDLDLKHYRPENFKTSLYEFHKVRFVLIVNWELQWVPIKQNEILVASFSVSTFQSRSYIVHRNMFSS